jgi:thiol-disulfide isomerase/thioredoxin
MEPSKDGAVSELIRRIALAFLTFLTVWAVACGSPASTPAGLWDATVVVNKVEIPFQFEITGNGSDLKAAFFDGDLRVRSTSGRLDNGTVVLRFDQYGSRVEAVWADDQLRGKYDRGTRGAPYPFSARRAVPAPPVGEKVPAIAGEWKIATTSSKGEKAFRFLVRQNGPQVSAAILRVDGDTGTLSGTFRNGAFVLSHFSGARPLLLEVTPAADGSLQILQNRETKLVALRVEDPRAKALPEPTDPEQHTTVKDPSAPFTFSFPDLNGQVVSNTDPRFRGKVVLVNITGSWCPNCHDEAPFLTELYEKYRQGGLEIVALAFEEADQLKNPERLRAFMKQFGITYPVLLAGEPDQVAEKLPQAVNLNAVPTTFIVGRDGRVRAVHAGFAGRASADVHTETKQHVTRQIEGLLAERTSTSG